jgi:hypothetical protein
MDRQIRAFLTRSIFISARVASCGEHEQKKTRGNPVMPECALCVDLPFLSDEGRAGCDGPWHDQPLRGAGQHHPAGDFLHVPEGGVHGFRNDSDAAATMLILFARHDQYRAT